MAQQDIEWFEAVEKRRKESAIGWRQRLFSHPDPPSRDSLKITLIHLIATTHTPRAFERREILTIGSGAAELLPIVRSLGARNITQVFDTYDDAKRFQNKTTNRFCYVADLNVGERPPLVISHYGFLFDAERYAKVPTFYDTLEDAANYFFVEGDFSKKGEESGGLSLLQTEHALKKHFGQVYRIKSPALDTNFVTYRDEPVEGKENRIVLLARR